MTGVEVYFADLRTSAKENLLGKVTRLLDRVGIERIIRPRRLVAVKIHFGELGNLAYIRPNYVRQVVDRVRSLGAQPFLTDCNTLYAGTRSDSVSHLDTALRNGFAFAVVNAPLIIADGLRGKSSTGVRIDQALVRTAHIGSEIVEADALIGLAHFKGHELSGFGGTIKNLGMGSASRRGKLVQHSDLSPKVTRKRCVGCGECIAHCAQSAITLREAKASIDPKTCVGCGECILICPQGAIDVQWKTDFDRFQKKMVEYAYAVLKGKKGHAAFLNFLTDLSPACDCYDHNDSPIVRNIGILASTDPVAIDQASADLVNREPALAGSRLETNLGPGEDKFTGLYPKVDWTIQLSYAEQIGLGSRAYDLVRI